MRRVFSDEQNPSIHFHFASPALWVFAGGGTCQLVRVKAGLQPGRDASLSRVTDMQTRMKPSATLLLRGSRSNREETRGAISSGRAGLTLSLDNACVTEGR